jgi:hypothetical protein
MPDGRRISSPHCYEEKENALTLTSADRKQANTLSIGKTFRMRISKTIEQKITGLDVSQFRP